MSEVTWTCHICGRTRPDARVGVVSREARMGGIVSQQNLRYCTDDTRCMNRADEWAEYNLPISFADGLAKL